jgi:dihydrofolate reductase
VIDSDVAARIDALKHVPGRAIGVTGSATLVESLLRDGLLDELRLLVHPIVVGRGRRLFAGAGAQRPLELVESNTFTNGVLDLTYVPASAA